MTQRLILVDDEEGTISAMLEDEIIRQWSYDHLGIFDNHPWKMRMAREFVEGWFQHSKLAEQELNRFLDALRYNI